MPARGATVAVPLISATILLASPAAYGLRRRPSLRWFVECNRSVCGGPEVRAAARQVRISITIVRSELLTDNLPGPLLSRCVMDWLLWILRFLCGGAPFSEGQYQPIYVSRDGRTRCGRTEWQPLPDEEPARDWVQLRDHWLWRAKSWFTRAVGWLRSLGGRGVRRSQRLKV